MCKRGYSKEWLREKKQVRWEDREKYLNGERMEKRGRESALGSWPEVTQNEVLILTRDIMSLQSYRHK
jgi:hypothetical protein